ncbi:MAG: hypothetical protein JW395_3197 [Nitrospira sp.]|nr:hypothetical protein [Nitrospira sp.]
MRYARIDSNGVVTGIDMVWPDTKEPPAATPGGAVVVIDREALTHVEYDEVEVPGKLMEVVSSDGSPSEFIPGPSTFTKTERIVVDSPAISKTGAEVGGGYDAVTDAFSPAPPPPPAPRRVSPSEFLGKFTNAEQIKLEELSVLQTTSGAKARVATRQLDLMLRAGSVDLDHPDTLTHLAFLKAENLLGDGTPQSADLRITQIREL